MGEKIVGSYRLQLFDIPRTGDSLLLSVIHQIQLFNNEEADLTPIQLPHLRLLVCDLLNRRGETDDAELSINFLSEHCVGGFSVISVLSKYLMATIEVYLDDGNRRTYSSFHSNRPVLRIYQYHVNSQPYYDSIIKSDLIYSTESRSIQPHHSNLCLGTWNMLGATSIEKRLIIDDLLHQQQLDILCVQETHLFAQSLETPHYRWLLGPQPPTRASRGCGFIIKKQLDLTYDFKIHTANICHLELSFASGALKLYIICIHKYSEGDIRSTIETGQLTSIIRELMLQGEVIICGDLNSHFGKDLLDGRQNTIGPLLSHAKTNANGQDLFELCDQLNLRVPTTILHGSTQCTWYRSPNKSQLDHVITPSNATYHIMNLRGHWTKYSDHKLLVFTLQMPLPGKRFTKSLNSL